jgi:sugar (pentulose or hexulose) kinase
VGWHALAGHWCLLGGTQGGLALQTVLRLLDRVQEDVPALDAAALALPGSLVELDLGDPVHPRVLVGRDADEANMWRAALDAVTVQAARVHAAMSRTAGAHRSITAAGGWSRSAGLVARKRALLGPVELSPVREPGARGAALFAGLAAGELASLDDLPGPASVEPS